MISCLIFHLSLTQYALNLSWMCSQKKVGAVRLFEFGKRKQSSNSQFGNFHRQQQSENLWKSLDLLIFSTDFTAE